MNWRENAHLFANGKFEVRIKWDEENDEQVPTTIKTGSE